jgi:hypothetical protein
MSISNSNAIRNLTITEKDDLKNAVKKIDDSLTRILGERNLIKNIVDDVSTKIQLDKKLIRKIAKTFHKASLKMDKDEFNDFVAIYENVYGDK